jgi:hypothetical protein
VYGSEEIERPVLRLPPSFSVVMSFSSSGIGMVVV